MNGSSAYASEAILGPPSDPINVHDFIIRCSLSQALRAPDEPCALSTAWCGLSEQKRREIEEECSVGDLEHVLNETLSNPFLYAHLVRDLEQNIQTIRAAIKPSSQSKSKSRKRKRAETSPKGTQLSSEVLQLRNRLDSVALKCWPYPIDAAVFTRPQKGSDLNTLRKVKKSQNIQASCQLKESSEAVIVVSVYNRLSWGNHLSCSSQHAVLATQTVGELYEVIPCLSNEMPTEKVGDGETVGYEADQAPSHRGCVVCIEGFAYGDGQAEEDYSDKLLQQIEMLPEKKRPQLTGGVCMHEQRFADLVLRLNQPYWLLHQGACEHFLVVDHIRMLKRTDPRDGYPLTLHITPPILDLCMACARVPAVLSVVGDVRLGQSPFKICRPCWTLFGDPRVEDGIVIAPLPKYEHGW